MADDALMERILRENSRLAVVGLSPRPGRPSHDVAAYMQRAGYDVTPVNPRCDEVLGKSCARDLHAAAARGPVQIVNVFRRSVHVAAVIDEALAVGARAIWTQLGVVDEDAAEAARAAGVPVVMDRCIKVEHARLRAAHGS